MCASGGATSPAGARGWPQAACAELACLAAAVPCAEARPGSRLLQAMAAGTLLGRPPRLGLRGAAADWMNVLNGMNLLGQLLLSLLFALPLPLAAATHWTVLWLTHNSRQLCADTQARWAGGQRAGWRLSRQPWALGPWAPGPHPRRPHPCLLVRPCPAQMLTHPLMLRRLKLLAAVFDTLMASAAGLVAPGLALGSPWLAKCGASPEPDKCDVRACRQVLLLLELTTAALPVIILGWLTKPGLAAHLPLHLDRPYRHADQVLRFACGCHMGWGGRVAVLVNMVLAAWSLATSPAAHGA